MAQYDLDLREYWRILRKRKLVVVFMVILVGVFSYGFAKLKEPTPIFEANAAIKIERMTSMADFFMGGFFAQTENIITHAFILTSFPVLEETAKMVGWLPADIGREDIQNSKKHLSVIKRLKSMIGAEQEPGTNILNIKVLSTDPDESAHVANAFARAYKKYNIQEKNKKTFETKEFIEKQLQLTSKNLKEVEEKIKAFKENYSLVSMDTMAQDLAVRISDLELEYEKVKRKKNSVVSQLAMLKSPDHFARDMGKALILGDKDTPLAGLKSKLNDLLLKKQTLLIDFTEQHPQVIEVKDQIKAVVHEAKQELVSMQNRLENDEARIGRKLDSLKRRNLNLPEKALQIVRLQREAGIQEALYSQLKTKHQETLIKESGKIEEVTIVRPATVPSVPINIPSKFMIVATGIVMGLIIGMVFVFVAETLDTSIGTIEDVEELLGVPVLGVIPFWGKDETKEHDKRDSYSNKIIKDLITHFEPASLAAEAFRSLRTNLQFMGKEMNGQIFLVTSSFVQEGKTVSASNLALSMAQAGNKVLLVEADLRKPRIHREFGLNREPGIADYVLGNYNWADIVNTITDVMVGVFEIEDILKTPGMDNLNIVTSGTAPTSPSEIIRSSRFREFIDEVREEYTFVILDAPPILPVADATDMAGMVDGVIMVYKAGEISRGVVRRAKTTLDNVNAKVVGTILNSIKPEIGPEYFKYHTSYYYSEDKETEPGSRNIKTILSEKFKSKSLKSKFIQVLVAVAALALLIIGIFWKDIF